MDAWYWVFDLTSHFRVQYAVILSATAIGLSFWKRFRTATFFAAVALLNIAVLLPCLWPRTAKLSSTSNPLRAVLVNVRTENQRYDLVSAFILEAHPDFVVLEEIDSRWLDQLADLRRAFPHSVIEPRDDNFGIALFSKRPLRRGEIIYLGSAEVPSVVAELEFEGEYLTIVGTHPLPPGSKEGSRVRDEQLSAIPEFLAQRKGPVVLLGDLNITPWCASFRRLLRATGLHDSSRGYGIQASWPAGFFPLRIPIDHCLVSPDLTIVQRQIGRAVGSDHLPLIVDLAFSGK